MPMTRTRSFPHPFATPNNPKGRLYNDMTYVLFDHAVWRAISTRTNAFREKVLGLPPTTYEKLEVWKIPYLYSFSTSIVPSPLDWMDWVHCTGYWFLDNPQVKVHVCQKDGYTYECFFFFFRLAGNLMINLYPF
jgi:hypothetical protein